MPLAIFNISNSTLNLAVSLAIFALVVIWLAMVVYTFLDARRRVDDPFLVGCATIAALFPFIGTAAYVILRPPELLEDARERELEMRAAEMRVRHLTEQSCPGCGYPVEKNYLRCPQCERHLKDPCDSCSRPVNPRWALCPYCEKQLPGRRSSSRKAAGGKDRGASRTRSKASPSSGSGNSKSRAAKPAPEPEGKKPSRPKPAARGRDR